MVKTYSDAAVPLSCRIKSPLFSLNMCPGDLAPLSSLGVGSDTVGVFPMDPASLSSVDVGSGTAGACPVDSAPFSSVGVGSDIAGACPGSSAPLPQKRLWSSSHQDLNNLNIVREEQKLRFC